MFKRNDTLDTSKMQESNKDNKKNKIDPRLQRLYISNKMSLFEESVKNIYSDITNLDKVKFYEKYKMTKSKMATMFKEDENTLKILVRQELENAPIQPIPIRSVLRNKVETILDQAIHDGLAEGTDNFFFTDRKIDHAQDAENVYSRIKEKRFRSKSFGGKKSKKKSKTKKKKNKKKNKKRNKTKTKRNKKK